MPIISIMKRTVRLSAVLLAAAATVFTAGAANASSGGAAAANAANAPDIVAPYTEYVAPTCSSRYLTDADNNSNYVMDASGYGNPANVQVNSPNGGANQHWCAYRLNDGYYAISAYYATSNKGVDNYLCLYASSYSSGVRIQATQCDTVVEVSEQWVLESKSNGYAIVPAYTYFYNGGNLCVNSSGGIKVHASVILYYCTGYPTNEQWDNPSF
jgi:hypothetical protein